MRSRRLAFAALGAALAAAGGWWLLGLRQPAVRILPLGDSITEGKARRPSYRAPLDTLLADAPCAVDLVGSQRGPERDPDYDADHEGHWGWRTDEVADALPGWLRGVRPDVVLVHLGTNDVLQGRPTRHAAANLRRVIATLRSASPDVTVLLAQVIPARPEHDAGIRALNEAIAAEARRAGERIVLVDQHAGYDRALNYDGIHPDTQGAERIARRWYAALAPELAERCARDAGEGAR